MSDDAGLEFEVYDEDDEGEYMAHVSRYQLYDVGTIIYGNGDLRLSFGAFSIEIGTIFDLDDKMNTEHGDNHSPTI